MNAHCFVFSAPSNVILKHFKPVACSVGGYQHRRSARHRAHVSIGQSITREEKTTQTETRHSPAALFGGTPGLEKKRALLGDELKLRLVELSDL